MNEIWNYITPGMMGVNNTDIFVNGAKRFGKDKGISFEANTLLVNVIDRAFRDYDSIFNFIVHGLELNLPIAFLNLSNGVLKNLDNWHWVTIVGINGDNVLIFDQGKSVWINLCLWLNTTLLGGGFVTLGRSL